jgi:AAA domain
MILHGDTLCSSHCGTGCIVWCASIITTRSTVHSSVNAAGYARHHFLQHWCFLRTVVMRHCSFHELAWRLTVINCYDGMHTIYIYYTHTLQGTEADIVLISTVRSCGTPPCFRGVEGVSSFMRDPRRLNVALSRAK